MIKQTGMERKADDSWPLYGPKPLPEPTPVPAPAEDGLIVWEIWKNSVGTYLSDVPFDQEPTEKKNLLYFEGPVNIADDYGSRLSGLLISPVSGKYTFYIAADNKAELWLSGSEDPSDKKKIAEVTSYTSSQQWDKYASQKSVEIILEEGKKYYIEAIHKEGAGGDNLAVGWQLPNGTYEKPLPAGRFAKAAEEPAEPANEAPAVNLTSPYSFSWEPSEAGEFILTAKALDDAGASSTSASAKVVIEKEPENISPVLSLSTTEESLTLPENTLTLSASASDPDGTIVSQEWRQVSGPSAVMKGSTTLSLELSELVEGPYLFGLTVTDNKGASAFAEVKVVVLPAPNQLPIVDISSPAANTEVEAHKSLTISATASDPDGTISTVAFFLDGQKIGEKISAPFNQSWLPTESGQYALLAKATDNKGAVTNSKVVYVKVVLPQETENIPPVLSLDTRESIRLPKNTITLTGTAYDEDGTVSSYSWIQVSGPVATMSGKTAVSLQLSDLVEGIYVFRLTISDNDGTTVYKEVLLEVLAALNQPPLLSISFPTENMTIRLGTALNIAAKASDADGNLRKVEFYADSEKLGEDNTAPYEYSWIPYQAGTYAITAKAVDAAGASATSEALMVTVEKNRRSPWKPKKPVFKGEGSILSEYWEDVFGNEVADLPLEESPTETIYLQKLEGPVNAGENYGSRIRGYIHPPLTGEYVFWIAGDMYGELWLSSDDATENKRKIAEAKNNSMIHQWEHSPSQKSEVLYL